MQSQHFLGSMTMATAAGVQPAGSVFGSVPSSNYLLGRDLPRMLPPIRTLPGARWSSQAALRLQNAEPCGGGA